VRSNAAIELNQDRLFRLQEFLNGFYVVAGIWDADGVGPAQFVMHQQFTYHSHPKIRFRHVPELTGSRDGTFHLSAKCNIER